MNFTLKHLLITLALLEIAAVIVLAITQPAHAPVAATKWPKSSPKP